MSLHRPQPFEIAIKIKPPASLMHTVEQRISHELKTVKRKSDAIETGDDPIFSLDKDIVLLHFNFADTSLNVDFYPLWKQKSRSSSYIYTRTVLE